MSVNIRQSGAPADDKVDAFIHLFVNKNDAEKGQKDPKVHEEMLEVAAHDGKLTCCKVNFKI